jgi:hypothetical protein
VYANNEHPCDFQSFETMRQAYYRDNHYPTVLSLAFWSDANMAHLTREVGRILGQQTEMDVVVQPDTVFYNICARLCAASANVLDVHSGLQVLNDVVAKELVYVLIASVRQRKLFLKWAVHGDRDVFLAPPLQSHGRKRIVRPTSEVYQVQHNPNGRYNQEFQQAMANRCTYSQFPMFDKVLDKNSS